MNTRASICSTVSIDIVDYTRRSVAQQLKLRERFNAALALALRQVSPLERIVLDTGSGAAIVFLLSAKHALLVMLALRATMNTRAGQDLQLRASINLGPVRLVKDANLQPNVIGDGISVAQSVLAFAQPGQIVVTRAYRDVVAALDRQYARLFETAGTFTDAHTRDHELFLIGHRPPPTGSQLRIALARVIPRGVLTHPRMVTVLTAILILLMALWVQQQSPDRKAAPATAPAAGGDAGHAAIRSDGTTRNSASATPAMVKVFALPWGEVYVDGVKFGVAPPLRDLALPPGIHTIELRNPGFASYAQRVELTPGDEITIRHRFQ